MARRYDLVVVGMGSAGMVAAELAATIGLDVAVVERARVGGDCLWTGCVPSKALLAAAKAAHTVRTAGRFGLPSVAVEIDTALVLKRVRAVQQEVASTDDSPDRYRAMGVEIVEGDARLVDPTTVRVGDRDLRTRFVLVCTGSRPALPPVPGLAEAGFLTSETVWDLERAPRSLVVIGGGPIAVELAQAFARLGVAVTVLQRGPTILPRDEPELTAVLARILVDEGIDLHVGVSTTAVHARDGQKVVVGTHDGVSREWAAEELLVAVGRTPNVAGLGLHQLGVEVGERGVGVDDRMRTAVPTVYACGDVAGRFLFTHSAAYEAVRAVRDMFYPGRGRVTELVPWCTFTDPELAHVGLTVAEARRRYGETVEVWRQELSHSDRARAEDAAEGAIVVVTAKRRVVGAHVLAPAAGEMIHELALAVDERMRLNELGGLVHVYPTIATGIGQLGGEAAFEGAKRLGWLVRLWARRSGGG